MEMDQITIAMTLSAELVDLSRQYADARNASAEAKKNMDIILAARYLDGFLAKKKNLGIDMAYLMLINEEIDPTGHSEIKEYYETYHVKEAEYKGIEKMIEAISSRIMLIQSVMKYQLKGEQNG